MNETTRRPPFVGPHEGRELDLMLARSKPLAMFVEPVEPEFEYFPEEAFDELVSQGKLKKRVGFEKKIEPNGKEGEIRRILYSLPGEEWRIEAILLTQRLYDSLTPGWRPDLDRVIGILLGYDRDDIEKFLDLMSARHTLPR